MAIGSGLGGSFGVAQETAVGTYTAPTRWLPFESEGIKMKKNTTQAQPLTGSLYLPQRGRAFTTRTVDGPVKMYGTDRQLGILFHNALGGTPLYFPPTGAIGWTVTLHNASGGTFTLTYGGGANTTSELAHNASHTTIQTAVRLLTGCSSVVVSGSTGGPYTLTGFTGNKLLTASGASLTGTTPTITPAPVSTDGVLQVYNPGDTLGLGMTIQVGRPETSGTVAPFTYTGCKVTDWELTVDVDKLLEMNLTVDGWNELTTHSLVAPSFIAANYFQFAEGTLYSGGTVTTVTGILTVTSPTTLATAKNFSVKPANKMDVSRFYLGSAGIKAEQLADGFRAITGSCDLEFRNLTDAYNAFAADTPTTLVLKFLGPTIAGTTKSELNVIIPTAFWDDGPPTVDGPQILVQKNTFTGLASATGFPAMSVQYLSKDTTA